MALGNRTVEWRLSRTQGRRAETFGIVDQYGTTDIRHIWVAENIISRVATTIYESLSYMQSIEN